MSQAVSSVDTSNASADQVAVGFVDRRGPDVSAAPNLERRQFTNSHDGLSPQARELALAIDQYKLLHRRRFITYEEMLSVITTLGYQK